MKRSILLILSLTLFVHLSVGQKKSEKVDILWGPEQKEARNSTLSDIVGFDDSGIYAYKVRRKGLNGRKQSVKLEHYNNGMLQTKSVLLNLKDKKRERDFEFIIHLNDKLYLFSSYVDNRQKKNSLYVQSIDKSTLRGANDIRTVAEIDFAGNGKFNSGSFDFELSRDSSKLLVYYSLPYERGENEKVGIHVLDQDLNQLWEKEITLPYTSELFDVEDYEVDNDGNLHLLGIVFNKRRIEKRRGAPNYKYQILSYYENGRTLTEYPVEIKGKFITDMQIAINQDQDIICGGFYSAEGTFSILGSYFLRIDARTKEVKSQSFKDFGIDFITQNMTEKRERKTRRKANKGKDVELYEYDLDGIILREDGGAVLIGEQYYIRVSTSTSVDANGNTHTTTTYNYIYNDIIVINVSPDGTIEWNSKIAKRQTSSNDGGFYSSYALSVVGDKLYFIFNDNPKNLFYKGEGKIYPFIRSKKESVVVLITLESNGIQTREALFSSGEADIITRPKVCEQISDNEMVLFGQRKKTQRFAKITFKE